MLRNINILLIFSIFLFSCQDPLDYGDNTEKTLIGNVDIPPEENPVTVYEIQITQFETHEILIRGHRKWQRIKSRPKFSLKSAKVDTSNGELQLFLDFSFELGPQVDSDIFRIDSVHAINLHFARKINKDIFYGNEQRFPLYDREKQKGTFLELFIGIRNEPGQHKYFGDDLRAMIEFKEHDIETGIIKGVIFANIEYLHRKMQTSNFVANFSLDYKF